MKLKVTVDQWETIDGADTGIINIYTWGGTPYAMEVFNADDDVKEMVEFLTGERVTRLDQLIFNPYGDGHEFTAYTEKR